jgi:hypothetical protein
MATIPEDQNRRPAPSDDDRFYLQRTTVRGRYDQNRLTIHTNRNDPPLRYFLEVRYEPMPLGEQRAYRVVVNYLLQ